MNDAVLDTCSTDHGGDRTDEERSASEATRLAKSDLGFEVDLTISGADLTDMLRACLRQLLEKHGMSKSLGHVLGGMRLQVNTRGAYVDVTDPIRFTNRKF